LHVKPLHVLYFTALGRALYRVIQHLFRVRVLY